MAVVVAACVWIQFNGERSNGEGGSPWRLNAKIEQHDKAR